MGTQWAPKGTITLGRLMGSPPPSDPNLAAAGPGLYRLEVRARHRRLKQASATEEDPAEAYELLAWPVTEDTGHVTIRMDDLPGSRWEPRPTHAAQLAMVGILTDSRDDPFRSGVLPRPIRRPEDIEHLPRARVIRSSLVPAAPGDALAAARTILGRRHDDTHVLDVGPFEVRLTPQPSPAEGKADDDLTLTWNWDWSGGAPPPPDNDHPWASQLSIPDPLATTVRLSAIRTPSGDTELTINHDDVLAHHAISLGLIWEYVLARTTASLRDPAQHVEAHPWEEPLDQLAREYPSNLLPPWRGQSEDTPPW
ncbi:MAG: hypothetical protein QG597_3127 [Actinomycetota bacterium]|nr:hypothetical protein [Actinomycetota bacterium]